MPLWWYYWARLSQIEISRCNSVTNSDVSHTYYKCKLRPNENAHIKCFEPNTHIHCICTVSSLHQMLPTKYVVCPILPYLIWHSKLGPSTNISYKISMMCKNEQPLLSDSKGTIFWLKYHYWSILWSKIS